MKDMEAINVAKALYDGWIYRFGGPLIITPDQGRQFESHLHIELCKLMGTNHVHNKLPPGSKWYGRMFSQATESGHPLSPK